MHDSAVIASAGDDPQLMLVLYALYDPCDINTMQAVSIEGAVS